MEAPKGKYGAWLGAKRKALADIAKWANKGRVKAEVPPCDECGGKGCDVCGGGPLRNK